ncbi:MAG: YggS family pyridoxal phosphate-dependent enzyme [Ignavibacteriales bacterium]|nr:YggS family pyridoxal phosphate-dependent enzyme [Ignavibacteriales bacterium]
MISENLKKLEDRIAETCAKCGRNRSEIKLIAVSKTQPAEVISEVLNSGIKELGENKALELRDKSELIKGDFRWHFIGHLQTNKVKYVINSADYIHAIDSIKLADEINRKAGQINKKQKILLEIKTSAEMAKLGLESEEEIFEVAEYCKSRSNLDLTGLMTMAPYTDDTKVIRNCFVKLREIKEKLTNNGFLLTELSMGMTNDYEIAIEEGATMLRIGTAIFGSK